MSNKQYKNCYRRRSGLNRRHFTNQESFAVRAKPTNRTFSHEPITTNANGLTAEDEVLIRAISRHAHSYTALFIWISDYILGRHSHDIDFRN